MKNFLVGLLLFVVIGFIVSCSSTVTSEKSPAKTAVDNTANPEQANKRLEYPPLASTVAEAEIKVLDGTTFKVADKKGKVILLNMWATWCGPCRAEMPALVRMQEAYRGQDFEVVGLNTDDETVEEINAFAGKMNLNYTLAWADTKLQSALIGISRFPGIPQSFLIDRDGSLRAVFKGAGKADIVKMEQLVQMVVNE